MARNGTEAGSKRDASPWKDRLIAVGLCFGAVVTVAWCAIIVGSTWWLVERMVF
ncbi:MAG: hypothetical protein K2Y56_23520 [Methylobacterium sp.]|uniref:hypothetical protein n=1 Tax=Methylobacterium sp. TaxID=409 RepID=UPI0025F413D6|nr:hypothetical protein [Methylobacterium sp.]MBX9934447.1 hypothetical protein [Methylobacterium sp.]